LFPKDFYVKANGLYVEFYVSVIFQSDI